LRYFSSAGYIVNKTRSSLDPNIVNMLVVLCLWDWCRWHWSYDVRYISITLNWLVILLSSFSSTLQLKFPTLTKIFQKLTIKIKLIVTSPNDNRLFALMNRFLK